MKVLLISPSYPPTVCGVGDYASNLVYSLKESGVDVEVCSSSADSELVLESWSVFSLSKIIRFVKVSKVDIVHFQHPTSISPSIGFQLLLPIVIRLLTSASCVITVHEYEQRYSWLSRLRTRLLCRLFKNVIVSTDLMANLLATNNIASSIIPIAHPFSKLKQMSTNIRSLAKTQQIELVFFGFLSANKSIDPVIDAVAELKNENINIRLALISPIDRNDQQHVRLQSKMNGAGGLWLTGATLDETQQRLASSDIAIFPFNDGASPKNSTLLAALSVGLPVISTSPLISPLSERVIELTSLEAAHIGSTIRGLASDKKRRLELSAQGRKLINDRYNWENITKLHQNLYTSLV